MKNLFIPLLLFFLICSCRENVLQYSCDPVLNEIVATHKQEYLKYAVIDIVVQDINVQRAIFRTYDPAKKREIWLEKLNYLLKNENYSDEEYVHVSKIIDFLNEHFFEKEYLTAEADQRKEFVSSWISYAKNDLGWSDRYVAFVLYRLYTDQTQFDAETKALQSLQQKAMADGETTSCNCNQGHDFCMDGIFCCSSSCETTGGCGVFWSQDCDGICNF